MYLTKSKSAKGRRRLDRTGSPDSPVSSGPDTNLRSQSQPVMWQTSQLSQDQVLQMLHHIPAAPSQSFNRYSVLPSIERRQSEERSRSLDEQMSKFSLSDDAILRDSHEEPVTRSSELPGETGTSLLLAIRAPCGRRFQQRFDPTDTLLMVRASAEVRYGAQYADASIGTMDVPRRTFTDMDLTLAQCGILNRSVLCISLNDNVEEHE